MTNDGMDPLSFARVAWRCTSAVAVLGLLAVASPARAELTDAAGSDYAALCEKRGVPLPPDFGGPPNPRCAGAACVTGLWRRSGQLARADGNAGRAAGAEAQSFNSPDLSELFFYVSTSARTPGLCVANARRRSATPISSG